MMAVAASHYDVLSLPASASASQIRRAYRQRAKESHPDKGGSDEQFQRLQAAYEALSDSRTRAAYDLQRDQQRNQQRKREVTRRQEEERLARAAAERARFVAVQRQKLVQQEKVEQRLATPPSTAVRTKPASGGRADARGMQQLPGGTAAKGPGSTRSAGEPAGVYAGVYSGVTGMDGANVKAAMFAPAAERPTSKTTELRSATTATAAAPSAATGSPGGHVSRIDAVRILHEGIRCWTAPYPAEGLKA